MENNFLQMINRIKLYYKKYPKRIYAQFIVVFLIITFFTGSAGHAIVSLIDSGSKGSFINPFMYLYYAWIKMFFLSVILFIGINGLIFFMISNIEEKRIDTERNFEMAETGTFGTGGFMTEEDKIAAIDIDKIENITGTILGQEIGTELICTPKQTLYLNGHKCICGGSGVRKTTTAVLNEVLQAIRRGESFLTTDPKAEIYGYTAAIAEEEGYKLAALNLINLMCSDACDFIGNLRSDTDNQDEEVENTMTLVEVIIANTTSEKEAGFWIDCQKGLLTAAILFCMYDETGTTKPTLSDAYDLILKKDKNLLDKIFQDLGEDHPAKSQYLIYAKSEDKVRTSVIIGLTMRLQVFQTSNIKRIVSENEIDLTLPGREKCAYYIIMSDQKSTYDFVASLFFSMFFIKIIEYADANVPSRRCDVPVNLIMDEFPSIGKIPDFGKKLATVRSRGLTIDIIFQNYSQIQGRYSEGEWETIVGNCDINEYLGGNDSESTAMYYSNRLGDMTVISTGRRIEHSAVSVTNNKFHPVYTETQTETTRPVMTKDELLRLNPDHSIVLMKSCRPLKVAKYVWEKHPLHEKVEDRDASIHIPNWRRKRDGLSLLLTDEELNPIIQRLVKTKKGKNLKSNLFKDYLERHQFNSKYMFLDYLADINDDAYDFILEIEQMRRKEIDDSNEGKTVNGNNISQVMKDDLCEPTGTTNFNKIKSTQAANIRPMSVVEDITQNTVSGNIKKYDVKGVEKKPIRPVALPSENSTVNVDDNGIPVFLAQSTYGIASTNKVNPSLVEKQTKKDVIAVNDLNNIDLLPSTTANCKDVAANSRQEDENITSPGQEPPVISTSEDLSKVINEDGSSVDTNNTMVDFVLGADDQEVEDDETFVPNFDATERNDIKSIREEDFAVFGDDANGQRCSTEPTQEGEVKVYLRTADNKRKKVGLRKVTGTPNGY